MNEKDIDIEDENRNPAEVTDDGLGERKPVPFDPKDVAEDDDE